MTVDDVDRIKNIKRVLQDQIGLLTRELAKSIITISCNFRGLTIAQQIALIKNCEEMDFDILQASNLAFQVYSEAVSNGLLNKDEQDELYDKVMTLGRSSIDLVKCLAMRSTSAQGTYGDDYITTQVYESSRTSNFTQDALDNGLTVANLTDCLLQLRNHYNISDDSPLKIVKTDSSAVIEKNSTSNKSVKIIVYEMKDKKQLDLSICEAGSIRFKLPLNNHTQIITQEYYQYKNNSIDIYNKDSEAFTSRCYTYAMDGYDTTANMRRKNIFANKTISCSNDCVYDGIDESNYINCDCSGQTDDDNIYDPKMVKYVFTSLSNINIDIVKCPDMAFNVYKLIISSIFKLTEQYIIVYH
jgi:hypothetical protein